MLVGLGCDSAPLWGLGLLVAGVSHAALQAENVETPAALYERRKSVEIQDRRS